jgi:GT2 family glycosyltransferase
MRICPDTRRVSDSWPPVSIVFVAYNRREQLAVSLEHVLERLDYPADRLEVIVVDNASTDGTAAMVRERFPQVRLMEKRENVGASAWNAGMETASGDWRLILDDDCYIEGDALKAAVRRAEEYRADLVSFLVASSEEPGYFNVGARAPGLLWFTGCSALFSRRAIETEPFYDPNLFIWGNELELTMRLLDRGMRHLYLPEVVSVHQKPLPRADFKLHLVAVNHRRWAYVAAKLLQPGDAVTVLGRLVLRVLIDIYRLDPRVVAVLPSVLAGFLQGLRYRRPVRPEVSSLYRRVCVDLSNPLTFLRTPMQRLRGRGDPEAVARARAERWESWAAEAGPYYPTERAVLQV